MCLCEYEKESFQQLLSSKSHVWDFPGSPVVRTLASAAEGTGSIPGQGTQIPPATQLRQQKKKKKKKPHFSQCSEEEKKMRGNKAKSVFMNEEFQSHMGKDFFFPQQNQ